MGSSSADACLDIFYSSAPYPPKEGRAKRPGVSLWILPISFFPMILKNPDLFYIQIIYTESISIAEKKVTKSTPILIYLEYYLLVFWHFFAVVVGVIFANFFFHRFSFPSNL